ncbi:MAG TPA: preprotein translocase subunit SecE [Patescibacteria group bacterium]|nr:preprotein translocase subunit SecE [Patescibacteria group bacterium]
MEEKQQLEQGNPVIGYFKGAIQEMKKVTWPSKEETWRKSLTVIWFSIGFAIFLGALDFIMNKVLEILL